MKVSFAGDELKIDGKLATMPCSVSQAMVWCDTVIVLLDPDLEFRDQVHSNLISVNANGDIIWQAKYPTGSSNDRYYRIASIDPLIAYSNQSYDCTLDPETGLIVAKK